MIVTIEGKMFASYQKPDYTDKETGETSKGKFTVQLMVEQQLRNDEIKSELLDLTIPNELITKYKGKEGQVVQIKCNCYVRNNQLNVSGVA